MIVPEKLINYKCYNESNDLLGVTDVDLPSIEYMTETVKGAGIAGEINSPTMGHFSNMEAKITWRIIDKPLLNLAGNKAHTLDLRGAQQTYDPVSGEYKVLPVKVLIKGATTNTELGKFEQGGTVGGTTTISVFYLKVVVDGTTLVEIDKYNYIANVGGTDWLSDVRKALGLS